MQTFLHLSLTNRATHLYNRQRCVRSLKLRALPCLLVTWYLWRLVGKLCSLHSAFQGQSRSPNLTCIHLVSIVTMHAYFVSFPRHSEILAETCDFVWSDPCLFNARAQLVHWLIPCNGTWAHKTRMTGRRGWETSDDIFSRVDTLIRQCDCRTDRQTDIRQQLGPRLGKPSRGKNCLLSINASLTAQCDNDIDYSGEVYGRTVHVDLCWWKPNWQVINRLDCSRELSHGAQASRHVPPIYTHNLYPRT